MQLTLELSELKPNQREALLALIESFTSPQYIPSADENSEHEGE